MRRGHLRTHWIKRLGACITWVALCASSLAQEGVAESTAVAADRPSPHAQLAWRLVQEEKIDEALLVAGTWRSEVRMQLLWQIQATEKGLDRNRAIRLYEAFFELVPFGEPCSHVEHQEWGDLASRLFARRKEVAMGAVPDAVRREEKAELLYRQILELYRLDYLEGFRNSRFGECEPIVKELIDTYPETLYCRIGVATASHIKRGESRGHALEKWIAELKARHVEGRTRLFLLRVMADSYGRHVDKPKLLRKAVATYGAIIAATSYESETANCLFAMATCAGAIEDDESLTQSRKWFEEYWTKYPGVRNADAAKWAYVNTFVVGKQFADALEATRSLRAKYPEWRGSAECRRQIAEGQLRHGERSAALTTLKGIVEDYPQTYLAAAAWAMVAQIQRDGGDSIKERMALNQAVAPVQAHTDEHSVFAHDLVDQAVIRLSHITMKNKEWPIAVDLCLRRRWISWCGTGMSEFEAANRRDVQTCLENLPDNHPAKIKALKILEERATKKLGQVFP